MTKVFIGGSRRINRLNAAVKRRIDNIIRKGLIILIGDANGADKAVQSYLACRGYPNVTVFCAGRECRNNLGAWEVNRVTTANKSRSFEYYATKDRAMAERASCGFMIWDAKSKGTLNNIVTLLEQKKAVLIYLAQAKSFHTLRNAEDLAALLRRAGVSIWEMMDFTRQKKIATQYDLEDLQEDIKTIRGRLASR